MKSIVVFLVCFILFLTGCIQQEENTIEITSTDFNPEVLKIKAGDKVIFINKDKNPHRPASDRHPNHNEYPETGGCVGSTFDACKDLKTDESFVFTFNYKGEWNYHDHLNSGIKGKIIVE